MRRQDAVTTAGETPALRKLAPPRGYCRREDACATHALPLVPTEPTLAVVERCPLCFNQASLVSVLSGRYMYQRRRDWRRRIRAKSCPRLSPTGAAGRVREAGRGGGSRRGAG